MQGVKIGTKEYLDTFKQPEPPKEAENAEPTIAEELGKVALEEILITLGGSKQLCSLPACPIVDLTTPAHLVIFETCSPVLKLLYWKFLLIRSCLRLP